MVLHCFEVRELQCQLHVQVATGVGHCCTWLQTVRLTSVVLGLETSALEPGIHAWTEARTWQELKFTLSSLCQIGSTLSIEHEENRKCSASVLSLHLLLRASLRAPFQADLTHSLAFSKEMKLYIPNPLSISLALHFPLVARSQTKKTEKCFKDSEMESPKKW